AGLPPDTTKTTAAVDGPSGSELTTTSVTAATGATPTAGRATTSTTAIPTTTARAPSTTTTTVGPAPTPTTQPAGPIVVDLGMRPSGNGGWMVRTDGTVIPVGDAPMIGDATGRLTGKATDLIPTASGDGYWIVGSAGEVIAL